MTSDKWNIDVIQKMIDDKIEENLTLEYKCAKALDNNTEITKDVSSFANSTGGTIIYGVKEYDEKDKKHLPERIDPIKRIDMPKERLEHIINNIKPKIDNLKIESVSINDNELIYVIEIDPSNTAHQAMDHRYYKRFNFMSVPMDDYEIRDIMNRLKNPDIDLEFDITIEKRNRKDDTFGGIRLSSGYGNRDEIYFKNTLEIYARNVGSVYAKYVYSYLSIPSELLIVGKYNEYPSLIIDNMKYIKFHIDNSKRDEMKGDLYVGFYPSGPKRFEPILPRMTQYLEQINLIEGLLPLLEKREYYIYWDIYSDNSPMKRGNILFNSIKRKNIDES